MLRPGPQQQQQYRNVAAGVASLAGIAAPNAICGLRLGRLHRGDDHQGAVDLIRDATKDGAKRARAATASP